MSEPTRRLTRRSILAATMAAATVPMFAACDGKSGEPKGGSNSSGGSGKTNDGVLTCGCAVGTSNVFPENFNVYGGGDSAWGNAMFYETLFRITSKDGMKLAPVLGEKVVYSDEGKTATYTLRKGVTWNDGKPFVGRDVAYTYNLVFGPPVAKKPEDYVWLTKAIPYTEDQTVVVNYREPQYTEDLPLSLYFPIYPEHIMGALPKNGEEPGQKSFQDKKPVGTGPGKLTRFAPQQIEIGIREDYWGGKSKGVKTVKIIPAGTAGNIESQITKGEVDWSEGGAPGVLTNFVKQDEHNGYQWYPDGSTRGIIMATHMLPTSDVAVRKALRDSIDAEVISKAGGIGYPVPSVTGLDPTIYASMLKPEYKDAMKPDVEGAKKALADAGWTVTNGNLAKDGKEYPLTLAIQNDNPVEMATMPVVVDMWKKNLGITVKFTPLPKEVFGPEQAKGKYPLSLWTTNAAGGVFQAFTMYMHTKIYKLGDEKADGNYGRYKLPDDANEAITGLVKVPQDDVAEITKRCQTLQDAIAKDIPYIPIQSNGAGALFTSKKWKALPKPEDADYFPRMGGYNNMVCTVMNFEPA